jgi:hypothetical protein
LVDSEKLGEEIVDGSPDEEGAAPASDDDAEPSPDVLS